MGFRTRGFLIRFLRWPANEHSTCQPLCFEEKLSTTANKIQPICKMLFCGRVEFCIAGNGFSSLDDDTKHTTQLQKPRSELSNLATQAKNNPKPSARRPKREIRGPDMDPKQQGSHYKESREKDPPPMYRDCQVMQRQFWPLPRELACPSARDPQ